MFQLSDPETFTLTRLAQIAVQTNDIQNQYIDRIRIDKMNREYFDLLTANIAGLTQ